MYVPKIGIVGAEFLEVYEPQEKKKRIALD